MKITIDKDVSAMVQPQQEPAWWPAVENILNEYGLQAIDFVAGFKAAMEQPQQPVGEVTDALGNAFKCEFKGPLSVGTKLYTSPPQRHPLTDQVLVPLDILEAAEISLGSFCSNHGWSADDMQTMDNISAYIAQHKAAHGIKDES